MIDTLIFDMGNVITHYQVEPVLNAKCDDPTLIQWVVDHTFHSPLWQKLDEGTIDEKGIYEAIRFQRDDTQCLALVQWALDQWPNYNLSINDDMIDVINYGIDHGMDLILLSNAPLKIHDVLDRYIPSIDRFKAIFISADLKMVKPDPRIFEYVLTKTHKKADHCLFIDDLKHNCDSAASLKFYTWQYHDQDGHSIITWLDHHKED